MYYTCYLCNMYTNAFLLGLIKARERASKRKKDEEIGKRTKWNKSTEHALEKMKQTKQKI